MLKFTTESKDGTTRLVGLGLSDENVRRLVAGSPIKVRLAEMGLDGVQAADVEILIFHGATEDAMRELLQQFVSAATHVDDRRSS